jgi:hypothetical protein
MSSRVKVSRRTGLTLALVAAALAAVMAAWLLPSTSRPPQQAAEAFRDPGLVHVHGLGVDPADGAVYAASHGGLFRLPDGPSGAAVRVADRWQDTMAFTVVGPNRFIASGHPDLREDQPVLLGLIETRDAGRTWQPLSLEGRSDFHNLQVTAAGLYGYDSTAEQLLVTQDRQRWQTRAKAVLTALAVEPASDGNVLLAADAKGRLRRSENGGRSFTTVPDGPLVSSLTWPKAGPVYGVTPEGTVISSEDQGLTWQSRAALDGPAEALVATDTSTMYAATESGIYRSIDGGATFTLRYQTSS